VFSESPEPRTEYALPTRRSRAGCYGDGELSEHRDCAGYGRHSSRGEKRSASLYSAQGSVRSIVPLEVFGKTLGSPSIIWVMLDLRGTPAIRNARLVRLPVVPLLAAGSAMPGGRRWPR
jgi:hypothetical protein